MTGSPAPLDFGPQNVVEPAVEMDLTVQETGLKDSTGLGAVAGGISEALVTTAIGLFVAIPAVWMFNYFTGKIEAFDVEMGNSSSELIDYFLKRSQRGVARK